MNDNVVKFPEKKKFTIESGREAKGGFMVYNSLIDGELVGFTTVHKSKDIHAFDKVGKRYKCNNADVARFVRMATDKLRGN